MPVSENDVDGKITLGERFDHSRGLEESIRETLKMIDCYREVRRCLIDKANCFFISNLKQPIIII